MMASLLQKNKIIYLFLFVFNFCYYSYAIRDTIAEVDAKFEQAENSSLVASVKNYLTRFLTKEANDENRLAAENFINSLKFVSKTTCMYIPEASDMKLYCQVISKYTVKNISFVDIPSSLLEEEIKRKLPIQVGTAVDLGDDFKEVLANVKSRVETFLKKNGYYGSTVEVFRKVHANNTPFVDINVVVKNGAFALVNSVKVIGESPVKGRYVKSNYQRMCLSFKNIIESMSVGTNCYSREKENETTQAILERFAAMGYVQARIRVSHHWINPSDPSTKKNCRNNIKEDLTPRCIDLQVEIDKGPLVRWSINIKDKPSIYRNSFFRLLSSIFIVDELSRASVPNNSDEIPLDHEIIKNELAKKITFAAARNVDEQEISRSAEQMKEYLHEMGYADAEVSTNFTHSETAIDINFDIYAGRAYFISSVRILPESYSKYISEDVINDLLGKRSMFNNGFIGGEEVQNAKDNIETILNSKGFVDIVIKSDLIASADGTVEVILNISSAKRETVSELIILNGIADINKSILSGLANCDNYKKFHGPENLCSGSSLISKEVEADAKKIEEAYKEQNYLYANVKSEVLKDEGNKIIFKIYDSRFGENDVELRKQKIKDIIISGVSSTNLNVIKRLFPYANDSSKLDPIYLKKGLSNIRESRRFSPDITSSIIAGQEGSDDVYFAAHLVEKPSLFIDLAVWFRTDELFSLEAMLEENNLFNSMLRLNTLVGVGLFWGRKSIISNKLVWPFIWGKNFQLTINAPRIIYDDFTNRAEPSRRLQSKVSFELEWRLTTFLKPYLKYFLYAIQEDKTPDLSPSVQERFKTLDGLISTLKKPAEFRAVLTPGIVYSSLDNPFDPRSGVDSNLWSEISVGKMMGDPSFVSIGLQNRFFLPLGPLTLALQATFIRSFIDPSKENFDKLKNSSFAMDKLGGDRSIRGYKEASIGISELAAGESAGYYGGYFSNLANIELRFPLASKDFLGRLTGAVFVDQGMLVPCSSFFNCMNGKSLGTIIKQNGFGLSVGAAVRYSLPVGPISLDYGISPITGDGRWHILFGYAF